MSAVDTSTQQNLNANIGGQIKHAREDEFSNIEDELNGEVQEIQKLKGDRVAKTKKKAKAKKTKLPKEASESDDLPWSEKLPILGYIISSSMHALAAVTNLHNFLPANVKAFVDNNAARFSKAVNSINYFSAAIEALKKNNILDFFARLTYPAAVPWMNLEDIHLAGGLAAGLVQIDNSQLDRVEKKMKGKEKTPWNNILANASAAWDMFKENLSGGISRHLKVFLGESKSGHPMALSGYFITFGSLIGVLFGANKRNFWNKLGGLLRNAGGFFGDFTMMTFKDKNKEVQRNNRISGFFYCINAAIDALQRFLPKEVINTVNHFNMILNNFGTYFFAQISRAKKSNNAKTGKVGASG